MTFLNRSTALRKMAEVNLYKWKLRLKGEHGAFSEMFVIDRGDNKRRKISELKQMLFALNQINDPRDQKHFELIGLNGFRGYALSYGCNA